MLKIHWTTLTYAKSISEQVILQNMHHTNSLAYDFVLVKHKANQATGLLSLSKCGLDLGITQVWPLS